MQGMGVVQRVAFLAALALIAWPTGARADSFLCTASEFCWDAEHASPAGCQGSDKTFAISVRGFRAVVEDGEGTIRLREVRPYFIRSDLYQGGDTRTEGLLELHLRAEESAPPFEFRRMLPDFSTTARWVWRGRCERQGG